MAVPGVSLQPKADAWVIVLRVSGSFAQGISRIRRVF